MPDPADDPEVMNTVGFADQVAAHVRDEIAAGGLPGPCPTCGYIPDPDDGECACPETSAWRQDP